jgi:hypothetical protein
LSLERSSQFHQVRRILKTVAPDFRILANPGLNAGFSALDLKKKTIEISESEEIMDDAVSSLLFQIGHAIWHKHNCINLNQDANQLAAENALIDQFALDWGVKVLTTFFNFRYDQAHKSMTRLVWSQEDWVFYFLE